jgi:hypothetical protein
MGVATANRRVGGERAVTIANQMPSEPELLLAAEAQGQPAG